MVYKYAQLHLESAARQDHNPLWSKELRADRGICPTDSGKSYLKKSGLK